MDVVVLRPLRDPRVRASGTQEEKEEAWRVRATEVLGWAYRDGGHVDLTYTSGEAEVRGSGEVIVETFRCGGFDWTPEVSLWSESR